MIQGKDELWRVSESQVVTRGFLDLQGQRLPEKKRNRNEGSPSHAVAHTEIFETGMALFKMQT